MSSYRQPIRTLVLAIVFVAVALVIRHRFENVSSPPVVEDLPRPALRVARDANPTIVEPNEDWLDHGGVDVAEDDSAPLTGPQPPDLPSPLQPEAGVLR